MPATNIETNRELASGVAKTICDHSQEANFPPQRIHELASRLAGDLGKLLGGDIIAEQLFAAALDDYMFPPCDNEGVSDD